MIREDRWDETATTLPVNQYPRAKEGTMSDAIDGLKIEVPGAELIELIGAKADAHSEKATRYAEQAAGVEAMEPGQGQTMDPVQALKQQHREHANKAELFRFIAAHLNPATTYRLSEADLIRVEIIERW